MSETGSGLRITWIDRLVGAWMEQAHRRPLVVLVGVVGLCLLSVFAARGLGVDADSSKMLSPDLPAQQRAHALNDAFPELKSQLVIVVQADQADAADLAVLALTEALQERSEWIDWVYAPASDPFLASHGFLYRKTDEVERAFSRLSKSANLLARLRTHQTLGGFLQALNEAAILTARAEISSDALDRLYDETADVLAAARSGEPRPFSWSSVLDSENPDGRVTRLVSVMPVLDLTRLSPAKPALRAVKEAIADLPPEVSAPVWISVTGEPALRAEEMQSVLGTLGISLTLSLIFVAVILRLGLRSTGQAALAFGTLVISLVLTTGFATIWAGDLNLVSVAFIVLMVGLGIDFAIHILAHIGEHDALGAPSSEAVAGTGRRAGLALALSAVTTSIAFLAFTVTDFDGMAQLGVIGSAGVLIAFLVAITVIPAVIGLRPALASPTAPRKPFTVPQVAAKAAVPLIVALGILSIGLSSYSRFDADPIGLRDPDAPSVQAFMVLAAQPETTPYRISILADSEEEAARIAALFSNIEGIGNALSIQDLMPGDQDAKLTFLDFAAPSIEHAVTGTPTELIQPEVNTIDGHMKDLERRLQGGSEAAERLFEELTAYRERRTARTDDLLTERLFQAFPMMAGRLDSMLMADFVTEETLPEALTSRFKSKDGTYRVEIIPEGDMRDPGAMAEFVEVVRTIHPVPAGGPDQLVNAADTIGKAMLQSVLLAAAATALLSWAATGRFLDMIAILAPLSLAGAMTAAAGVVLDLPFNYANVIVLPLLIGIGVDSGIHIALRERRAPGAVFATSTPRAVLFSALTTMAAFGTLALSDHRGTASMGILLAVSMAAAVACVLTLTPAVIRTTRSARNRYI